MVDKTAATLSPDNVRSLIFYLGEEIDRQLSQMRRGTAFSAVRPGDARILVIASRASATLSEIARTAGVTRQAVHSATQRLQALGLLTLESRGGDLREKMIILTDAARLGIRMTENQISELEAQFAKVIGKEGLELLRSYLKIALMQLRGQSLEKPASTPPA